MEEFPILRTQRLLLSKVEESDVPLLLEYMKEKEISDMTATLPYPYTENSAKFWLNMITHEFETQQGLTLAIRNQEGLFLGGIGLHKRGNNEAEIGYWLAKSFWNQGFMSEATSAILEFGFKNLGYTKVFGKVFLTNPASAKVLIHAGMKSEGILCQHVQKNDQLLDVEVYAIGNPFI